MFYMGFLLPIMFQNFEKYVSRSLVFNKVATIGLQHYYK